MKPETGMERRMSHRIPICISTQVYAYGMLVASGVAVEMSDHGVQILIHQDYSADELDPGKNLDVMLDLQALSASEKWLPIRVVRKWDDGIGACFVGGGPGTLALTA